MNEILWCQGLYEWDSIILLFDPFPQGVPGNGKMAHLDDLLSTCTNLIFICSAGHAMANFGQYDDYGFPPNYPALLNGDPPTDKVRKMLLYVIYMLDI